jgi:hypothetical protein
MTTYFYYKISQDEECYVGKTTDPKSRLATHKSKSLSSSIPLYEEIRKHGGFEAWKFEILETKQFENTAAARAHEHALYVKHNATLNVYVPGGHPSGTEYYQANKERLRILARDRYTKTKTEWKGKKKTVAQTKAIHLRRIEKTGKRPTQLTKEKYEITDTEIQAAIDKS